MTINDRQKLNDFKFSSRLEWIETNGLGGYASATVSGVNSRKYHGLLVGAMQPPVDRRVLVAKLDETIVSGTDNFSLATNQFPGAVHPNGYLYLQSFERDLFPVFYYRAGGIEIKKTIASIHGENTTLVIYEVMEALHKFTLELQPFYACRDIHHLAKANDHIGQPYAFYKDVFRTMNYLNGPEIFISVPNANFIENKSWFYNFEYLEELNRGNEFQEDLYTHGKFNVELKKGSKLGIILSTDDPTNRDALKLLKAEHKRRENLVKPFATNNQLKTLALAADQFIVKREELNTIIAGYHWFTDWGRDTMISLSGLCLVTERFKDAKRILQNFAAHINEGMLPNRFPDSGESPEYNTMDATLWFFQGVYKYYQYTDDRLFIKAMLPVLKDIIEWHYKGTRYNIHVDPEDELVSGGAEGIQLTWMDAKVEGWVVTPRRGKPVEINALWYNALCIMNYFMSILKYEGDAAFYQLKADRVRESFNDKFWNIEKQCLYDCIDGDNFYDEIRPNQIYAVSLPFTLLEQGKASQVLDTIMQHLFTPKGLRSLSPTHKDYKLTYEGGLRARDAAYHQGTVWCYLIGAYIDALFFVKKDDAHKEANLIISNFLPQLNEACIGSLAEITDAEFPFTAKGCVAQAWSVAESLRVVVEHNLFSSLKDDSSVENIQFFSTSKR